MRKLLAGLGLAALIGACAGGAIPGLMATAPAAPEAPTASSPHIAAAVADTRRPETDTTRDALRHPAEVMAFAGVREGWRVADVDRYDSLSG